MSDDSTRPFHFTDEQAAALGREPAGRGRFGRAALGEGAPRDMAELDAAAADLEDLPGGAKTDGRAILLPPKAGVLHGQLLFEGGVASNFVDPRGCAWQGRDSVEHMCVLISEFLDGHEPELYLQSPIDDTWFALPRRALAIRLLSVNTARTTMKEPPVRPSGAVPVIEATPEDLRRLRAL